MFCKNNAIAMFCIVASVVRGFCRPLWSLKTFLNYTKCKKTNFLFKNCNA